VLRFEAYYGFYQGNLQLWDTDYVKIPQDTPEETWLAAVQDAMLQKIRQTNPDLNVAFTGIACGPIEDDNDPYDVMTEPADIRLAALFVIDPESNEATYTMRFCGAECRQDYRERMGGENDVLEAGTEMLSDVPDGEVCTECGQDLQDAEGVDA
jgi:hypothetical protein